MKKIGSNSCRDIPKGKNSELKKEKNIMLSPSSNITTPKNLPLAQLVPVLPESKFFPTSGRNIHMSRVSGVIGSTVSANISTNNSANSSVVNPINLTTHNAKKSESGINFSIISQEKLLETPKTQWLDLPLPTTPAFVLQQFSNKLSPFEQSEILRYKNIYSIGAEASKVKINSASVNFGFDDELGDYKIVVKDHIAYRFEVLDVLGCGSFGQVVKVFDYKHQTICALKIIRNKSRFKHQAEVEIEVLKALRKKDDSNNHNVVHILSSFQFRNHVCISFELLSMNLYDFIKGNNFQGLSLNLIKRFAIQILQCLCFLYDCRVIHCDLKPENILLRHNNRSAIKVIDFGSSCFIDKRLYTYIQSRFYRAPEIILGLPYTMAIDMWSFGCILCELYTGYPIFPGESEVEQLLLIMEYLNVPPTRILGKASRVKVFFDIEGLPKTLVNSKGKKRTPGSKKIRNFLKGADERFIGLVEECFVWESCDRITPHDALASEWILDSGDRVMTCRNSDRKSGKKGADGFLFT